MIGFSPQILLDAAGGSTIILFTDGSWSWKTGNGGWASVAQCGNIVIRCKAGVLQ